MLRLKQKHSAKTDQSSAPIDVARLLRLQSPLRAAVAAVGIAVVLDIAWLWLSDLTGSFFHGFSLLQGPLIGLAVQRAGRGIDWRFPLLAAIVTIIAAFGGNFLVSLLTTAAVLEVPPLQVLGGLTVWSWQTWYAEVLTSADLIYALFAAAVAAFFSRRRLRREEVFALRSMKQEVGR